MAQAASPTAGHDSMLQGQMLPPPPTPPPPPPPPPPNPWEAVGLAFTVVGLAALLLFLVLGSVYFLWSLLNRRKRQDDDDHDEEAAAVEQQLAELPPAPRHDPHLARGN